VDRVNGLACFRIVDPLYRRDGGRGGARERWKSVKVKRLLTNRNTKKTDKTLIIINIIIVVAINGDRYKPLRRGPRESESAPRH